jgi:hypothetical protein
VPFYERGQVRIHFEEVGSDFPLLVVPGGGLNSTFAGLATHAFNPINKVRSLYENRVPHAFKNAVSSGKCG